MLSASPRSTVFPSCSRKQDAVLREAPVARAHRATIHCQHQAARFLGGFSCIMPNVVNASTVVHCHCARSGILSVIGISPVETIAYQLAWITSCLPTIRQEPWVGRLEAQTYRSPGDECSEGTRFRKINKVLARTYLSCRSISEQGRMAIVPSLHCERCKGGGRGYRDKPCGSDGDRVSC